MERLCDLHTHTTASDGSFAPEESVRYAKQKGALALAVTDHDTIAGLGRAVAEGERIGQQVIPGIEITTKLESCEIHVVGLFIRWQDREFARRVEKLSKTRDVRNEQMLKKLMDNGFCISKEDMSRFSGSVLTKAHIGKILVERGYAKTVTEAMNTYLRKGDMRGGNHPPGRGFGLRGARQPDRQERQGPLLCRLPAGAGHGGGRAGDPLL